ncbi:MAG TPA: APC family permease [Candidatus Baltobacteraceae bacterium]|nr:APC family permease [Candidatus Baltobacteraceae bacterium]
MSEPARLRSNSLSFPEVLATSIALIGLSMTPVLIAPYIFAGAGNASWLAYIFAGVMLLFVALNLNQFARRSTGAGSMYGYAAAYLGTSGGALAGWALIWAYVFVGASQFGAMALFIGNLAQTMGLHVPALAVVALLAIVLYTLAFRDIALSTIIMLVLESISVVTICIIIGVVLVRHGPHLDQAQLHLQGMQGSGIGLGIATAIFSFVGFECATAFGEEARNPLITIPRAVVASVIIATLFFVLCLYGEVLGMRGSATTLDKLSAPLWTLADLYKVPFFKIPIALGAIFSSFSVGLACVTTGARIILAMARKQLFPPAVTAVQRRFATPYVAVAIALIAMLVVALAMYAAGVTPINVFNYCGTLSAFGFIVIYGLIALAAPRYLRQIGDHRPIDYVIAALALVFLLVPAVTLFYPAPPPPTNAFAYIFLVYMAAGYLWFAFLRHTAARIRTP